MKNEKRKIIALFVIGLILIVGAPYFPSFIYNIIYSYDMHFMDIRFNNVIPCFRTGGVVLSAWGIAIFLKGSNYKN